MPNQCVHCGKVYADGSKELLTGCSCGSHFFYFIKKEYYEQITKKQKEEKEIKVNSDVEVESNKNLSEIQNTLAEINKVDKIKMEKDVREIIGLSEQEEIPVILDLESIRVIKPGKFEIDIVNLFNKKRPLIYKLEEGKYIIDLASTLKLNTEQLENLKNQNKFGKNK